MSASGENAGRHHGEEQTGKRTGAAANAFANDGSFLEQFKKKMESGRSQAKKEIVDDRSPEATAHAGQSADREDETAAKDDAGKKVTPVKFGQFSVR